MTITLEQQIALVEDRFSEYGYATDRAILASLKRLQEIEQQEPAIPEGYRLVPIEPTEAMIEAGNAKMGGLIFNRAFYAWKAMLEASEVSHD